MTSHGRAIRESNRTTTSSPSPLLSPPITSREASPVRSQVSRAPARRRQRQRTTWRGQPAMSASSSSRELSPASAVSNSSAQGSGNHDARKEPSDSRRTPNGGSTAAGSERVTANPNFSSSDSIVSTAKQALPSSSPSLPLHSSAVKAVRAGEESRSHSHPRSQSVNIVPQSTAATYRSSGSGTRTSQTKSSPGRPVGALSSDSSNLGVSRTPSIVLVSSSPTSARPSEPPSTPAPMLVLSGDDASDELEEPVPEPTKVRGMSTVAPKLETVQEGSDPATTAAALTESNQTQGDLTPRPKRRQQAASSADLESFATVGSQSLTESGSDSGDDYKTSHRQSDLDSDATPRAKTMVKKSSFSRLAPIKYRTGTEPSARNVTVETETVTSIPQATIGTSSTDRNPSTHTDENGVRVKASNDTMRPKKDRKRTMRKPPSVASGTVVTKADVFEAKVAKEVHEVNSSDSDDTFVYESNPPDSQIRPSRHHSRTPSATSMRSIGEQRDLRSISSVLEVGRGVVGKRSMKFSSNSATKHGFENEVLERDGTRSIRATPGANTGGGTVHHHHHIGYYGRAGVGELHSNEGELLMASNRNQNHNASSRHSSRPPSPGRARPVKRFFPAASSKTAENSTYTVDAEGADDERAPLIGTIRATPRRGTRRSRNPDFGALQNYYDHQQRQHQSEERRFINRFAGCLLLLVLVLLAIFGVLAFLLASIWPLLNVEVREVRNVLASEQELMLDLLVRAANPNFIAITISDMDLNVFARSKYVGSERWWREHGGPFPPKDSDGSEDDQNGPDNKPRQERSRHRISSASRTPPQPTSTVSRAALGVKNSVKQHSSEWMDLNDFDPSDPFDPILDQQTMLLGRTFQFDAAPTFEGSASLMRPLQKRPQPRARTAVGSLRLANPGNHTETGGTPRWERVVQHKFELIVKGVLRYPLPLSTRWISIPVTASLDVLPEKESGEDKSNLERHLHFGEERQ